MALKQTEGAELEIIGFARRPEVAAEAVKRGIVDKAEVSLARTVSDADLVVIATPVMAIRDILSEIADHLPSDSIVTDTGSTKAQVMKWAHEYLPSKVSFIGGHPMTGKETSGLSGAEGDLLEDCVYCLTPSPNVSKEDSEAMQRLVESVRARPLFIDAEGHDWLVAGVSHLPILISTALVSALASSDLWPQMSGLAATGYRDITRLASGSPEMGSGICFTNRKAIIDWLDRYVEELNRYRHFVLEGDSGLEEALREARDVRQMWLQGEGTRFKG